MTDNKFIRPISAPESFRLPLDTNQEVIILPEKVLDNGDGLYAESAYTLFKDLRSEGINVSYLNEPTSRKAVSRFGVPDKVIDLMIGFAGNFLASAAWYFIQKKLENTQSDTKVTGKFATCEVVDGKTTWKWSEIHGTASEVAQAMKELSDQNNERPSKQ
jgi:hypothetical protein